MNMFELQERLKDFSQEQLVREMQAPSGTAPQYMVLSELQRRSRMKQAFDAQQAQGAQSTVAEDAVNAAGLPQGGLADMARTMAPQSDIAGNTGVAPVARMAGGGEVRRMQEGSLAGVSPNVADFTPSGSAPPVTYQQWLGMSRLERERAGLPTSTIGGEMYFNRFGVGMGRNDPETGARIERPEGPVTMEDAALGLGVDQEFATPPSGEGYFPTLDDVGSFIVGQSPQRLYDIAEGLGFGPALEQANVIDPSRRRAAERFEAEVEPPVEEEEPPTPTPLEATTSDPLSVPEEGVEELLPPPRETGTSGGAGGGAGGGSGTGGGLAGIDRMMEQDKWLALAQFGLGLMSSTQPTLGGAIGEAGTAALGQLRESRQQAIERDLAERTLAARMAASASSARDRSILTASEALSGINDLIESTQLAMSVTASPDERMRLADQLAMLQAQAEAIYARSGYGPGTAAAVEAGVDLDLAG